MNILEKEKSVVLNCGIFKQTLEQFCEGCNEINLEIEGAPLLIKNFEKYENL